MKSPTPWITQKGLLQIAPSCESGQTGRRVCGQETAGEEEAAKRRKKCASWEATGERGNKSSRECRGEEGGWCSREIGLSVEEMAAHRATEQDFGRALLNIVATLPVSLFTDLDESAHGGA